MAVKAYPLAQNLAQDRFSYNHYKFRKAYPNNGVIHEAAEEYAAGKLDDRSLTRAYLIYLALWNDGPKQRRHAGNLFYDLSAVTSQHVGKTVMVLETGSIDELASAHEDYRHRRLRKLPYETLINVGRIARGPSDGSQPRSDLNFQTRSLKTTPHPRLPIPNPSLSFEIGLTITRAQQLKVDEFGSTTVVTGEPNDEVGSILMIEGGAPLRPDADYQGGRQLVPHEFVIGESDVFKLVELLYGLHHRGNMDGFADHGMTDYLALPDLNQVFEYGQSHGE